MSLRSAVSLLAAAMSLYVAGRGGFAQAIKACDATNANAMATDELCYTRCSLPLYAEDPERACANAGLLAEARLSSGDYYRGSLDPSMKGQYVDAGSSCAVLQTYAICRKGDPAVTNAPRASWMQSVDSMNARFRSLPINKVVIPGTHDSGTYALQDKSAPDLASLSSGLVAYIEDGISSPDALSWLDALKLTSVANLGSRDKRESAIMPPIKNLAITQTVDLAAQLAHGYRFLDLRLCMDYDGNLGFCHSAMGANVLPALSQVAAWTQSHPSEIVVLKFASFTPHIIYAPDGTSRIDHDIDHSELVRSIKMTFGDSLALATDGFSPNSTVGDFYSKHKNVIILYDNDVGVAAGFWPGTSEQSQWWRTDDPAVIESKLSSTDTGGIYNRPVDALYTAQFVLTIGYENGNVSTGRFVEDFIKAGLVSPVTFPEGLLLPWLRYQDIEQVVDRVPRLWWDAPNFRPNVLEVDDGQSSFVNAIYWAIRSNLSLKDGADVPYAVCKDVTVPADSTCQASPSIDNGTFDTQNNTLTMQQFPAGPYAMGTTQVELDVHNALVRTDRCKATVLVVDKTAPVLSCSNQVLECTDGANGALASFTATALDNCTSNVRAVCPATQTVPLGVNNFICSATDTARNQSTCTIETKVLDTKPPVISSVTAAPAVLGDPHHAMVPVNLAAIAKDACSPTTICRVTKVISNEPDFTTIDGDQAGDAVITGDLALALRDEWAGIPGGRIYIAQIDCTDPTGNTATKTVDIAVPVPAPPQAAITVLGQPDLTRQITLDASKSTGFEGKLTYFWQNLTQTAGLPGGTSGSQLTVQFASAGTYTFQLTVTDIWGRTSTATVSVPVVPLRP